MPFTTLIDTAALSTLSHDRAAVLVDCRYSLDDRSWGGREYGTAHIPGALFADMDDDLSGPKSGKNGRHPLPDIARLSATFGQWGIERGVQVVAYDQDAGMYASRLWWLLRWLGHDAAAVLDGGFAKGRAEGRPTVGGDETAAPRQFVASPRPDMMADAETVGTIAGRQEWRLLDARAPERFRGEVEPIDPVAGHIPGASSHPYRSNVTADATFLPAGQLAAHLRGSLGGVAPDRAVCYCGSGVTACQLLLAFEHAGLPGAKLYPGSWSEWVSDPGRGVATGA